MDDFVKDADTLDLPDDLDLDPEDQKCVDGDEDDEMDELEDDPDIGDETRDAGGMNRLNQSRRTKTAGMALMHRRKRKPAKMLPTTRTRTR